jgi:ABC-2 type transport system permease protein
MQTQLRIFWNYLFLQLREYYEYPLNFVIGFFWVLFGLVPFYFLWSIIIGNGNIVQYTLPSMVLYFLFSFGLTYYTGYFNDLRKIIVTGDLAKILVRKITLERHLMYTMFAKILTHKMFLMIFISIVGIYFFGFGSLLGILFYLLGVIVGILVFAILITFGFWTGDSWGYFAVLGNIIYFTSGGLIPLDLMPAVALKIINYMPFKLMIFVPAKIYIREYAITYYLLLEYLIWIIALFIILKILIHFGLKRCEQLGE